VNEGIRKALTAMTETGAAWVDLGVVDSIEEHAALGYLANVTLTSRTGACQARLIWPGGGASRGLLWPVAVGDEVLVLIPSANPNRAVAIAGLVSTPSPLPSDFDNTKPILTHPSGLEVRAVAGAPVSPVVTAFLNGDLADVLFEIGTALAALMGGTLATSLPNTAAMYAKCQAGDYLSASIQTD
jgi:hypothetical protein